MLKHRKNKRKVIVEYDMKKLLIFLVFVLFLGIGYSAIETDLDITGNIGLSEYIESRPTIKVTNSDDRSAFRSDTYRERIKIINLDDEINPPNNVVASWDIGVDQNENVMAYITVDQEESNRYDLYIQGDGHLYANEDSKYLFAYFRGVDSINGLDKLNVSGTKNMASMFQELGYNSWYFTIDLGNNFDTSNVTNMNSMFLDMGFVSNFLTLDLGDKFDTSNVTDMSYMFDDVGYNSPVFTLDLGDKFDTSNVLDLKHLFCCVGYNSTVFTLDLGDKFDTSKAVDMQYMFNQTGRANQNFTLDLKDKFDTSNVTSMLCMFNHTGYVSTIFTLNLGDKFDTSQVTDMGYMFDNTGHSNNNLEVDLSTFDFSSVTNSYYIFNGWKTTHKIYVKDAYDQNLIINYAGNSNLTTSNVLIKT